MDFIEDLLSADIRNNSAWNQRFFIVSNTTSFTEAVIESELAYTIEKIKFVKTNESAWNYLRGVLAFDERGLCGNPVLTAFCEDLYASGNRSPFLLAMIIDICVEAVGRGGGDILYTSMRGTDLCKEMAEKFDKIRAKYWQYISNKFVSKEKKEEKPYFCQMHKGMEQGMEQVMETT